VNFKIIQSLSDLPNFSGVRRIMFDTETSGFDYFHGDRICGFSLGAYDDPNHNLYLPIRHRDCGSLLDSYTNLPVDSILRFIQALVGDPEKEIIGHHLKFDINMLKADGIEVKCDIWDTMLLAFDLDGNGWNYELDTLTKQYTRYQHIYWSALDKFFEKSQPTVNTDEGKSSRNYSLGPIEMVGPYACEDIFSDRELCITLETMPRWPADYNQGHPAWGLDELLKHDMRLVKVLARMEYNGVKVNAERCAYLRDNAEDDVATMNEKLYRLAGRSFQVSSAQQTAAALCNAGGRIIFWSAREKGKMKSQKYTTDESLSTGRPCFNAMAILEYLKIFREEKNEKAYEFILTYHASEQKRRLIASNLEPYLKRLDMLGYLHGQFHQHRVVTGRLASSNPNQQNVTRVKGTLEQSMLEAFVGSKETDALNKQIRGLFIAEPGDVLVSIDQSQVEYRSASYLSEDVHMIDKYANDANTDYHAETMAIAHVERVPAKNVAFGALYGMGIPSLAAFLNISRGEAEQIFNKIMHARPALRRLMNESIRQARMRGFTQNVFGRRCDVGQGFAYKALCLKNQGMCGDLMRYSLVQLDDYISLYKLPVKMLLTVHDEIVFSMCKKIVVETVPKLVKVMTDNWMMPTIPLYCDADVGPDWGKGQMPLEEWSKKYAEAA
jgi:DNA polymerase-1